MRDCAASGGARSGHPGGPIPGPCPLAGGARPDSPVQGRPTPPKPDCALPAAHAVGSGALMRDASLSSYRLLPQTRPDLDSVRCSCRMTIEESGVLVLAIFGNSNSKKRHAQLNPLRWSGSVRMRLPVAAKMALPSAASVGGSVGSPRPVGA